MKALKQIVLCADDFGLNPAVCLGILELVKRQRLSAVSCMTNLADCSLYAKELLAFKNQIQIGLHFNLTEGNLISDSGRRCFSLRELLVKTHLRLIKPSLIAQEFNAQLNAFIQMMGCLPDFIDGHQHIHQFPVIRQVILSLYEQRLRANGTSIRSTWPAIGPRIYQLKTRVLAWTGGRALHFKLKQSGIPHNSCFAGIYDFAHNVDYRNLFRQWVASAPENTLIMCHPGQASQIPDQIAFTRQIEFNYFMSDEFVEDINETSTVSI